MLKIRMLLRLAVVGTALVSALALAQAPEPEPKIVVVPYPGEGVDGGVTAPAPAPVEQPQPPAPAEVPVETPPTPQPETRTLDAVTPGQPPPELTPQQPPGEPVQGPGAFLDGHPREGAFLSGPGSLTFVLHHSIMGGVGLLATQMVPRIADSLATKDAAKWTDQNARIAYLAGSLIGAGLGFGASAWWQFTHWMNTTTATFGIVTSLYGAMFLGGMTDLFTHDATAISWLTFIGSEIGGWLLAIVGGGDMPLNKGLLVISGGAWAAIYTALILAVVATTGGGTNLRAGIDALMITPAIGAAAMAIATLKFNPSTLQIMRANIFGVGVGAAVLLVSALVLGANFGSPVPYILATVGAIGAKTVVSLLWAEAAETPQSAPSAPVSDRRYRSVW